MTETLTGFRPPSLRHERRTGRPRCAVRVLASGLALLAGLSVAAAAWAFNTRTPERSLAGLTAHDRALHVPARVVPLEELYPGERTAAHEAFLASVPESPADLSPRLWIDRRSGTPALAILPGIPWVPGAGNDLTNEDVAAATGVHTERGVDLAALEALARDFVSRNRDLLGVTNEELILDPGASGSSAGGAFWVVEFDWAPRGMAVKDARLVFRVGHGNLVQFGSESIGDRDSVPTRPAIGSPTALKEVQRHVGTVFDASSHMLGEPLLELVPSDPGEGWSLGEGYAYRLVWRFRFQVPGDVGSWAAGVDAVSGHLLYFRDENHYGTVKGDVRPNARSAPIELALPFADYGSGLFADASGQFPATPAPASRLQGKYIKITDGCGEILNDQPLNGDLDFGGRLIGRDCENANPQYGDGNTLAARTAYYHGTRVNQHLRTFLPDNPWLDNGTFFFTNASNSYCNAYWNPLLPFPGQIVFLQGPTFALCWNFGEIDSVIYHEFGHGLDQNDGTGIHNTTEAYADVVSFLLTRDSCMGRGGGVTCGAGFGYNCTTGCDGFRELDYGRRTGGPRTPHATCGLCTSSMAQPGPCGLNPHCESHVGSGAMWELVNTTLPAMGLSAERSWQLAEELWYRSVRSMTSMYHCGGCPYTGAGAGIGTLYANLTFYDDCDGDLTNGTPHAPAIFSALHLHGIAAGAASDPQNRANDCTGGPPTPQVRITSPEPGAFVNGVVPFEATVTYDGPIDRVRFHVDGELLEEDLFEPYAVQWNTLGLPDGSRHQLSVTAIADDGAQGTSGELTVTIDYDTLSILVTTPTDGSHVTDEVAIEATTAGLVTDVEFVVDGEVLAVDREEPWATSWDTSQLPHASEHRIEARAYGTGGTQAGSRPVDVVVDHDLPAVELVFPPEGEVVRDDVTLEANAGASRPITKVEFFVDGASLGFDTAAPYRRFWNVAGIPDGSQHTLFARAFTSVASADSEPVTVTVDRTPPAAMHVTDGPTGRTISDGDSVFCCSALAHQSRREHRFEIHNDSGGPLEIGDFELTNVVGSAFYVSRSPESVVCAFCTASFGVTMRTDLGIQQGYRADVSWTTNVPGQPDFRFQVTGNVFTSEVVLRDEGGSVISNNGVFFHGNNLLNELTVRRLDLENLSHETLTVRNRAVEWGGTGQVSGDFRFNPHYVSRLVAPGSTAEYFLEFLAPSADPPLRRAFVEFVWEYDGRLRRLGFRAEGTVEDPTLPRLVLEDDGGVEIVPGGDFLFGTAGTRCAESRTLTLRNRSSRSVAVSSFALAGPSFRLADGSEPPEGTLGPGESRSFTVELLPSSPGPQDATLEIETDDPNLPIFQAQLLGEVLGPCTPADGTLCLHGGRFALELDWENHHPGGPTSGSGHALPFSDRAGFFWFFDPSNVEVMVKMSDGRPVNEHFWVFHGGLTDLAYTLEVTDTETGEVSTYEKTAGSFCGGADNHALADLCGASNLLPVGVIGAERAGEASEETPEGEGDSGSSPPIRPELTALTDPGFLGASAATADPGACVPDARSHCLLGGRFRVSVDWVNPHGGGQSGTGTAVPLTDQTGLFWFFNQAALELAVKVVDGRPVNGHFWVFLGSLSDVEYTVTVEDTVTGQVRRYHNPAGRYCGRADTTGFDDQVLYPELQVLVDGQLHPRGATVDFGSTLADRPVARTLQVTNAGSAGLRVDDVRVAGGDGAFTVAGPTAFHLAPGESQDLDVTLTADGLGSSTDRLEIVSDDPAGPYGLDLTGVVQETPRCVPGPETLCLHGGRFAVTLEYLNHHQGGGGQGKALEFSDRTGLFWFFNPANVEAVVKVIDGTSVNGHWWVFHGNLTDLAYTLTVKDVLSGERAVLQKSAGDLCGGASTTALPGTGAGVDALSFPASVLPGTFPLVSPSTAGACVPDSDTLCLLDGRFAVEADFVHPQTGSGGTGTAVPYNDRTGFFWFFHGNNLELPVKVVDGRPVNGHVWFFFGSLTNAEYTVRITDTVTGLTREYAGGSPFCGAADTAALPGS